MTSAEVIGINQQTLQQGGKATEATGGGGKKRIPFHANAILYQIELSYPMFSLKNLCIIVWLKIKQYL